MTKQKKKKYYDINEKINLVDNWAIMFKNQ